MGGRLFSVTDVMGMAFRADKIPPHVLEHAASRGTVVHRCCSLYARRIWFKMPGDKKTAGYIESFKAWWDHFIDKTRPIHVELELICSTFGFMGHPDIIAHMRHETLPVVIDLKTPRITSPTWKGQLASYKHLAKVNGFETGKARSLQLQPNGSAARAAIYEDHYQDFAAFLNGLNFFRYFTKRGMNHADQL